MGAERTGLSQGEGSRGGCTSSSGRVGEILYLVYEASCRVSYAVVALQYIAVSATNIIIIYHIRFG